MLRLLSRRSTLYTEMVTANTIVHCSEAELPRFLAHDGADHSQPVVLQLGGADPDMLRKAMVIARPWGYTSVNLNVGCPSERVAGAGCFGAALMREPDLVGDCCAAMADGADGQVPVTVKCRIGVTSDKARAAEVDDQNDYEALANFIERVSTRGGVRSFTLHARKAVLGGLSPAQNRQIPPLRYHLVRRLAEDFPTLRFALNGGVETLADAAAQLNAPGNRLSGVMVGRAVVARPWEWATVDTTLYGEAADPAPHRRAVFDAYCEFAEQREAEDRHRIRRLLLAPALNLFTGEPHGKKFRRVVDEIAAADRGLSAANILRRAADETLLDETLDAPPGAKWDHMRKLFRALSSAPASRVSNPLLDVDVATSHGASSTEVPMGIANIKSMAVSYKKLRHVANLAQGLYWREAMMQLEFCSKGISVFVKNGINQAVKSAEELGLDPTRLVVAIATVGKGSYRKELQFKNKGRAGMMAQYRSHLYIAVKEVPAAEIQRTRFYGRWRASANLLSIPWNERVAMLPRYQPVVGYEPGEPRVREMLALVDEGKVPRSRPRRRIGAGGGMMGKSGRASWKAR